MKIQRPGTGLLKRHILENGVTTKLEGVTFPSALRGETIDILPSAFAVYETISNSLDPGVTKISF